MFIFMQQCQTRTATSQTKFFNGYFLPLLTFFYLYKAFYKNLDDADKKLKKKKIQSLNRCCWQPICITMVTTNTVSKLKKYFNPINQGFFVWLWISAVTEINQKVAHDFYVTTVSMFAFLKWIKPISKGQRNCKLEEIGLPI